ncbi:MAG: DUF3368 domain-containing protein [Bacteroidota bacterium]
MTLVSNTTPLHYLVLIDAITVLPALFGPVAIPETVRDELAHSHAPEAVRSWIANSPDWLQVAPAPATQDSDLLRLDPGERDAILLAESGEASLLLIDERIGRATARARGLRIAGTLGVIERATSQGLLNGVAAIERLRATNARLAPSLLDQVVARLQS